MNLSGEGGPDLGELQPGEFPGTESGTAGVFELFRRKGMNDQQVITEIFKRDINAGVQKDRADRTPRWGDSRSFSWTRKEEVEEDRKGTRGWRRGPPEAVYGGMPDAYCPL